MASSLLRRFHSRIGYQSPSFGVHAHLQSARPLSLSAQRYASGDLGNPQSSSTEESGIKTSRAIDGKTEATPSTAQPVSNRSKIPGEQDEGTPSHDQVKRDPSEPAEKKRAHVESEGQKPLGPEDDQ